MKNSALMYAAIVLWAAVVFVADFMTPLGVVVWILYIVPLAFTVVSRDGRVPIAAAAMMTALMVVTFMTDEPGIAIWVAQVNRSFGLVVIWTVAFLIRGLINNRNAVEAEEWVRGAQSRLLESLQGDPSLAQLGERTLAVVTGALDAVVAAIYAAHGPELRLVASHGLQAELDVPETFRLGEGLVGEAARNGAVTVLRHLPDGFFRIRSALTSGAPRHLIVCPLATDGATLGVLELGLMRAPDSRALALLERARGSIAVALRSAFYRTRLQDLLEETQRQAEELQAQQEELRVTNEELEEQSRALKASQVRLEQQQSELEATNVQLETQAEELEQQKDTAMVAKQDAERANQYKSEFLANMSHELRTPLNSALILAKLLAENRGNRLSDDEIRYAETIYASGNNLLTLINDILDLSKIEAGAVEVQPTAFSPRTMIESLQRTFQPIAEEKGLDFRVELATATPATVTSDAQRLQQIVTNLLSNAFKFTSRGEVVLRVGSADPSTLEIAVRDTGSGIPPEKFDVIFEAFRQADGSTHRMYGGTGLGLSIARELAHLLGGDIRVESRVGVGSTFTLRVATRLGPSVGPRQPAAQRRPSTAAKAMRAPAPVPPRPAIAVLGRSARAPGDLVDDRDQRTRQGRLILVVEDDPAFARILYDLAHELDFDCVVATSNEEGMALARDMAPSGVLLDVGLPDGSGLTLLDRLKRNPDTRHIPVHVVSVNDHAQTALELGAVGYAIKPVRREEMVKAVQKLEATLEQRVRRVLVVEDDEQHRESTAELLRLEGVVIEGVGTAKEALERLASESFDCVVLDLNLPDASGYEVLETMAGSEQYSFPPVIVYTGRVLSREDEERLRRFSRSVILKGARSPERLLDEVTLFLHQVETRLPPDSQRLLRVARERDALFEGKTILVVEDDVRNIFALASMFEPRGAKIIIARNGREALEQVDLHRPDLVLMDIMMPEMDGLAATRALRAQDQYRDLPIIALTAKAMRDDYEQCLAAGANDYMTKPIDVDKLVSLCRVWIAR